MPKNMCARADRLLEDSPAAFYWAGLLAADGYVGRGGKYLKLTLTDHDHVVQFSTFLGWKGRVGVSKDGRNSTVAFGSAAVIPQWSAKFDMRDRKTYNPPQTMVGNADQRFAFAIGFVDGDGCIRRQSGGRRGAVITVKCHASWLSYLDQLRAALSPESPPTRVNARGYAFFSITQHAEMKRILARAKVLRLPLLSRKWVEVDMDFVSRVEAAQERLVAVTELLAKGEQKQIVADKLGISSATMAHIIKNNGIKTYSGRGADLRPRKRNG